MKPLPASSGDLLADRRADYAEALFASQDYADAAELMLGALELAPGWALGWFRLGEMQEAAGDLEGAAQAWTMALKLDPADRPGSMLKLALIGKAPPAAAPPSAFVEALFDQYAPTFDTALVEKLDYRVPEYLAEAIRATGRVAEALSAQHPVDLSPTEPVSPAHPDGEKQPGLATGSSGAEREHRFRLALDLGCGTGLMGERLRPLVERLEGFDISAEMLRKAERRGVYDRLGKADLQQFSYDGPAPDLVTAADVFMYVGALEKVVATVAGLLAAGGLFAFSVEKLDAPDGFALQPSRRYAHSQTYVRAVLSANGLAVVSLEERIIRQDRRQPVAGLIVVARR